MADNVTKVLCGMFGTLGMGVTALLGAVAYREAVTAFNQASVGDGALAIAAAATTIFCGFVSIDTYGPIWRGTRPSP
jgi:hypothetical protein